jgi:23S rRNA (guanosine2251-2'-O)-methyltransferase
MTLQLRNPHSVLAVLQHRPADVLEIQLGAGGGDAWAQVRAEAEQLGVPLRQTSSQQADAASRPRSKRGDRRRPSSGRDSGSRDATRRDQSGRDQAGREQSGRDGAGRQNPAHATVKERPATAVEELVADVGPNDLFLALDQLQDPQNVGSIFRTAAFFGVRGIVMTQNRAAPLTGVTYDVASGGMEAVPFAQETNLRRALQTMRDAGVWLLGSSEHAETSIHDVPRDRAWVVVVGNEEQGLRRLTQEDCDVVCRIPGVHGPEANRPGVQGPGGNSAADAVADPAPDPVTSLNVAVATSILLSSLRR